MRDLATAKPPLEWDELPVARQRFTIRAVAADALEAERLAPGEELCGRYAIVERIGEGGMGTVYRALDRDLEREVAIKLVRASGSQAHVFDECRSASTLSHPNIVNVHGVESHHGRLFLTMELLEGRTLRQELAERAGSRGLDCERALSIVRAVCDALAYAHRFLVHGDVKPENVFLCSDGTVKLLDFGVAKLRGGAQAVVAAGASGTPGYLAPEQLRGDELTPRVDQYAVAAMLYEMLTGEIPVGKMRPLRSLRRDVPRGVAAAVERALSSRPDDRFIDVTTFSAALARKFDPEQTLRDPRAWLGALVVGVAVVVCAWAGVDLPNPWAADRVRAEAIATRGEISALRERMTSWQRDLAARLNRAERGDAAESPLLESIDASARRSVFESPDLVSLEGQLDLADDLLEREDGAAARDAFVAARQSLESMLALLVGLEPVARARADALHEAADWLQAQAEHGDPVNPAGADAELALQAGERALAARDVEGAQREFARAVERYRTAIAEAPRLAAATRDEARREEIASFRVAASGLLVPISGKNLSFSIDRTEVSVGDYRRCVDLGGCKTPAVGPECNWKRSGSDDHPMNCVRPREAAAFCEFAGKRLPTDPEWEQAAQGADGRVFPWGSEPASCERAVVGDPNPRNRDGCGRDSTWPVGSKAQDRSPYGVLDLAGNVAEWTTAGALRGGDWIHPARFAHIVTRRNGNSDSAGLHWGFRCAK